MPFEKAVNQARKLLNANVFPESTVFRQAWEKGEIDENILLKLLGKSTVRISEYYLQQMASHKKAMLKTAIMI
jgi:uncharacterized protein YbcC (UPF0753/DUF2309 family)